MVIYKRFVLTIITVALVLRNTDGFMCPTLFDFHPDPDDCSKFYRCFWGAGFQFNCPTGTRWNHKVLTCDFAYNVDCDNGVWNEADDYLDEHINDHTHDYNYDYFTHHDYNNGDYGGDSGRPRDDSNQWSLNAWTEKEGGSEALRETGSDSQPADSGNFQKNRRPPYDTGSPRTVKVTGPGTRPRSTTDAINIDIKTNNNSGNTEHHTTTATTTLALVDKLLKDHIEQLEPMGDKPDRKGARGSFLEQVNSDRSRNANVDYVYYSDKEDSMKNHGRFGYYGFLGKHRSGYYAQPSQRLPLLWPFGKRK